MRQAVGIRLLLYILGTLVLCLVATSIWADFVAPIPDGLDQHRSRMRLEEHTFAVIAVPPAVALGRYRGGVYTDFAYGLITDHSTSHYNPPPGIAAFEFLRVAVPFWFLVIAVIAEAPPFVVKWARIAANRRALSRARQGNRR